MLGDEKGMICIPNESGWMKTGAWYDVAIEWPASGFTCYKELSHTKTRPFWRIIDKVSTSMMRIIIIIIIMMVIQSPPTYMPLNLPIPSHCKTKKKESQLGGMPSWKARSSSTLRRSSISSLMVAIWISDAVCGRLTCPEQSGKVPQQHGQWRSMQITFKKCGKCTRVKFHTMQRIKSLFQLWNITLRQPSVDWKHVLNNQDTRT